MKKTELTRATHTLSPYLITNNAAELIEFVKKAFGAEELYLGKRPDGSIHHSEFVLRDSLLEIADGLAERGPEPAAFHLYVPDVDNVYRRAVEAGGVSLNGPRDQDYGDREAGIRDPSGNTWWIATHQGASYAPEGFRAVTMWVQPESAAALMDFAKNAFGAQEVSRHVSPEGRVAHAVMRIGDSVFELSDPHGAHQPAPRTLRLFTDEVDPVYAQALAAGAASIDPPSNKEYGERSGGVRDPFGNTWYIAKVLS